MLGVAGYSYFAPPPGPDLEADTDIEVTNCYAKEKRDVTIRLNNTSSQPMRVVGLTLC